MGFRITTWNVNGIRNPFGYQPWREKRTYQAMFDILEADIVIMQETKIQRKDLTDDMVLVPGWDVYFSLPRHKKGYSGVAIYTRNAACAPIRAEEGITGILTRPKSTTQFRSLPKNEQIGGYPRPGQLPGKIDELLLDSEGRCVILEFPGFVLIGVYSPANRDESRVEFRMEFLQALDVRVRNLIAEGKQVILTGDLNVTRSEMDSTNVAETLRKEGLSIDEWMNMPSRRLFNHLLFGGDVSGDRDQGREQPVLWDLCREFHPKRAGMNTCWDTKRNTRPANNGSRIDYVLCSEGLKQWFMHANIQEGLMGSDHCPVFATVADRVAVGDMEVALPDLVNPHGMFKDGQRIRDWRSRDVLPLSAKLIPEFDRRQSIRDMFTKKSGLSLSRQPSLGPDSSGEALLGNQPMSDSNSLERITDSDLWASASDAKSGVAVNGATNSTGSSPRANTPPPPCNKRLAGFADPAGPSSKRTKASIDSNTALTTTTSTGVGRGRASGVSVKGQKTLQGFFKPVASTPTNGDETTEKSDNARANRNAPGLGATRTAQATKPLPMSRSWSTLSATTNTSSATGDDWSMTQPVSPAIQMQDKVFDPIQAKESWSRLLGKRVLPRCEHNEPCISLVTKKPGVNCGRSFYICPRPLGPSGEKEKGSEWRCGTFIWSSDWNGLSSQ